jgi:hypothetical protein
LRFSRASSATALGARYNADDGLSVPRSYKPGPDVLIEEECDLVRCTGR